MKKTIITLAVALGLSIAAIPAASAGPVLDSPVYCGPGYHAVGAKCIKNKW